MRLETALAGCVVITSPDVAPAVMLLEGRRRRRGASVPLDATSV